MGPPFQFNPVHINKNLIQFPQCRYASETIDSWCLQCYLIRHAPLKVKFKKISGQYWLPSPTIIQLSSYLQDCFRSKSVVDNAQRSVAFAFWFIFSKKTLAVWGCLAPSYVFEHFQTHFFSILRVELVQFSALILHITSSLLSYIHKLLKNLFQDSQA